MMINKTNKTMTIYIIISTKNKILSNKNKTYLIIKKPTSTQ